MGNMNPLSLLSGLLSQASQAAPVSLRESHDIDRVLSEQKTYAKNGSRNFEPKDLQIEAVQKFWSTGRLESLRDARLVSFGLTVCPWGDSRSVIENSSLFGAALDGVSSWKYSPRQFRKCYQGLARSYFDYDIAKTNVSSEGKENWASLREYLRLNVTHIKDEMINPDWVECALENKDLFTNKPCDSFGKELLEGDTERVDQIRNQLGINDASWFTRELIMAQLVQATQLNDEAFPLIVSQLLRLIARNDVLRDPGMKLVLNRYASIPQVSQHVGLKEQVVEWWGNPWLPSNQDRWGGVTNTAREMVSNWLKGEFIDLFFTKLAQDGLSDTRRVRFWEKFIPSINSMQFALGSHAMFSREKDYVELRAKLKGLLISLDDGYAHNNAFIMRIGDLLAVEFSGASNAFYGYSVKRTLPFDLSKPVKSGPVNGRNSLKNDARLLYLRHQDGIHGFSYWEDRFKDELLTNFGIKPGGHKKNNIIGADYDTKPKVQPKTSMADDIPSFRSEFTNKTLPHSVSASSVTNQFAVVDKRSDGNNPEETTIKPSSYPNRLEVHPPHRSNPVTPTPKSPLPTPNSEIFNEKNLEKIASRMGGAVDDNRAKGGALWIRATDHNPEGSRVLRSWGFTYKQGKGWWKDDEK
ncbi:EH signature domain containing protein [Burkholderiaceae bacterium]